MKVMRGKTVLVEDTTFERCLLRVELKLDPDETHNIALYAHEDESAIDLLVKDANGQWSTEPEVLVVVPNE